MCQQGVDHGADEMLIVHARRGQQRSQANWIDGAILSLPDDNELLNR